MWQMRRVIWTKEVISFVKPDEKNEGQELLIDAIPLSEVLSIVEMNQGSNDSGTNDHSSENVSTKNLIKKGSKYFAVVLISAIHL
jgi:hypothetical protein